jgi:hypothetical protein
MRRTILACVSLLLFWGPALALSVGDLNAAEQKQYQAITDAKDKDSFLITRDYVRKAQAVVDDKAPALTFPGKPKGFRSKFISSDEKDIINEAVVKSIEAMSNSR